MSRSWIPQRDADLNLFARRLASALVADPDGYGVTAGAALELEDRTGRFELALAAARKPGSRMTIALKNQARQSLLDAIRDLAARIQATASVTPAQKRAVGLHLRKTRRRTPTMRLAA